MDFSRLDRNRVLIGGGRRRPADHQLLFLPWFDAHRHAERAQPDAWLCGVGEFSCTGWETFPILRWLLLAGRVAPLILAWILVRGHKLSWAPGELTMVVGFAASS